MSPEEGLAASMPGLRLGEAPFSTSKLCKRQQKGGDKTEMKLVPKGEDLGVDLLLEHEPRPLSFV